MALYYDAVSVLESASQKGSLKSCIYAKDTKLRSKPAHLYALISECAKYDVFVKEVIDNSEILNFEPKLTPLSSLLLVHDHLFAKSGIAAPAGHPLRQSIERHRARLQSEFTKSRLRRRVASVEQLKVTLSAAKGQQVRVQPRWARVNTLKIDLGGAVRSGLTGFKREDTLENVIGAIKGQKVFYEDAHIPNLLAFPPDMDLTSTQMYKNGHLILQDKASCFPAHLLVGDRDGKVIGDAIDGCAAPGNKTTHLAACMRTIDKAGHILACERDATRSQILQTMVSKAGADEGVTVLQKQDFLALDSADERFVHVTHLLLDPSCSGSGIMRREDIPKLALPTNPRAKSTSNQQATPSNSKKRKRGQANEPSKPTTDSTEMNASEESQPIQVDQLRLQKLSNLQSLIVEHAFSFPHARCITYSTCSIHIEENEAVVERVLNSKIAQIRGWRVLKREEQVSGLKKWKHRGVPAVDAIDGRAGHNLTNEEREACIRCTPDDGEGTMGFFVCGFVRDVEKNGSFGSMSMNGVHATDEGDDDEWDGFSDT